MLLLQLWGNFQGLSPAPDVLFLLLTQALLMIFVLEKNCGVLGFLALAKLHGAIVGVLHFMGHDLGSSGGSLGG